MLIDETILIVYILTLTVLFIFASHGFVMLYYHRKCSKSLPIEDKNFLPNKFVTIQLPIYNEYYVAGRLIDAVCGIDYPKDKLEIQVLDDSTDETVDLLRKIIKEKQKLGFDIKHIHRLNRKGYKAGALKEGLAKAKGEYIAIFDADFVPKKNFLKKTLRYFSAPNIGMVQTRWEHLNEKIGRASCRERV